MNHKFITTCGKCEKEFVVFWAMDQNRVGPETVADLTCPVCGKRFNQSVEDLLPYEARGGDLLTSRPVRTAEVVYDCPHCGGNEVIITLVHTDLPWEDWSKDADQVGICNSGACPQRGLPQKLKATRVQLGALNPCWEQIAPL